MRLVEIKARITPDATTEYQFVLVNSRGKRLRQPWVRFQNGRTIQEVVETLFDARNLNPKKLEQVLAG